MQLLLRAADLPNLIAPNKTDDIVEILKFAQNNSLPFEGDFRLILHLLLQLA
jgi:hypothetical protein